MRMKPIVLNDATFQRQVIESEQLVLVDFWASWCIPCKMIAPVIDKVADRHAGQLKVGKLNIDENPATAVSYGITGIPTLLFFKDGQVIDRVTGLISQAQLETQIGRLLSKTEVYAGADV